MTGPEMDDFRARSVEIESDFARKYAEINRRGKLRLLLVLAIGTTLMVIALNVRHGFLLFAGVCLLYPAWGLWSLRPGRCLTCGRYTLSSTPKNEVYLAQWWDLRPMPRSKAVWVCPEHMGEYFAWRVSGTYADDHE